MSEVGRSGVPVMLQSAGDTHIGGRSHNEDTVLLRPDLHLYLVADGAGGQHAGNVASSLASTTIAHFFEQATPRVGDMPSHDDLGLAVGARRLSAAVQEANREIITIAKNSQRHHGMGTTVVAVLFVPEHRAVHVAHVGDSRVYRMRDGRLEQLTDDHSLLNDVMELQPQIDNARVRKLPRNVVTRALGMSEGVRVSIRSYELVIGDRYLLCSDGISDVISDAQLCEALGLDTSCEDRTALLLEMALAAKAADNIAAVVVDVEVPVRRRASRPRMERYGIVSEPPVGLSRDHVSEESVPGIVVYGDGGPDHENAQPGIQVTTHELSLDDLDLDDDERAAFDEGAERGEPAWEGEVADTHGSYGDDARGEYERAGGTAAAPARDGVEDGEVAHPRDEAFDPLDEPPERQTLTPPDVRDVGGVGGAEPHGGQQAGRHARLPHAQRNASSRDRSGVFEDHPGEVKRTTKPGNPMAPPAAMRGRRTDEAAGAGRYTYVGAPPVQRPSGSGKPPPLPRSRPGGRRVRVPAAGLSQPRLRKPRGRLDDVRTGETVTPPDFDEYAARQASRMQRPAAPASPPSRPRAPGGLAYRPTAPATPAARPPQDTLAFQPQRRRGRDTPASTPLARQRLMEEAAAGAGARAPTGPPGRAERLRSLPPMRTPFETGEFMPDGSVVCHACGSVINSDAELCLYCGAQTGFVQQ